MSDPRSEVIALLQPRTVFAKRISGAGRWGVRYSAFGQPSFCVVLEGSCRLAVDGHRALTLEGGDFVLLPATPAFTISGFEPVRPERVDPKVTPSPTGEVRHGTRGVRPDVRLLGGYFVFDSPMRHCSCRYCLRWSTCAVSSACRCWCDWSAKNRKSASQGATSCSRA